MQHSTSVAYYTTLAFSIIREERFEYDMYLKRQNDLVETR